MKIFFPHIPTPIRNQELRNLVDKAMDGIRLNPFGRRGRVGACVILEIHDPDLATCEYHGLVEVVPELVARRLVGRLKNQLFKGCQLHPRVWVNRRLKRADDQEGACRESRRRPNLQIQMVDRVEGYTPPPEPT